MQQKHIGLLKMKQNMLNFENIIHSDFKIKTHKSLRKQKQTLDNQTNILG